ncbi:MAG: GTP cyclohydrolase I [Deltaproteobacteria bacterium]|nr:GTP cyclohydrolase I [Deltaproteobacteria bacterium]MBN2671512.1 GTP cyclohydrolase I [Deltaproteobacteria bacterium]
MTEKDEKRAKLTKAFEDFLRGIGRSPGTFPELLDTPVRAADMWMDDLLDGYEWEPKVILEGGLPAANNRGMVVIRDIFFHSICPHHLLPSHGVAHVAYMPGDQIVGFSKISRLVDCFAHRLTLQETIVKEVCDALMTHLGARGAACVIDAEQFCMIVRGVRKPGSRAITSDYAGDFLTDTALRMEFLHAIDAEEA